MAIKIIEDKGSYAGESFNWDKITHSLEPETEVLPEDDRRYFESKVKLLIGKEIRLSNIPKGEHMYACILRSDWCLNLMSYPMVVTPEYIRREIAKLLNRLGLRISEEGLGWKYGPMGFQHASQKVVQEVVGTTEKGK